MHGFISYSHRDATMVRTFKDHLKVGMQPLGVDLWIDEEIRPGDVWDDKIKDALDRANLFIFCISIHFLTSPYINKVELKHARAKHDRGDALVLPVIFKDCLYEAVDFIRNLQALPKGARPITQCRPYDKAYAATVRDIVHTVQERMGGHAS